MLEDLKDLVVESIQPQIRNGRNWTVGEAVNQTKEGLKVKKVTGLTQIGKKVPGNTPIDRHLDTENLAEVEFGADIKEKEFFLRPDVSFFNHGSYGAVPRRVLKLQEE
ncbi:reverse transcriptase [Plakobranchus ocellatus]|uniref:Reverse transcriptase n=1 Tax=Plakobranchus ocellatus TaxID=259542 RepID=A0AAV3YF70_9GAST|nr:reverse transcriptase [Plakobranchus ocellatus]